jgi:hypothetical protein
MTGPLRIAEGAGGAGWPGPSGPGRKDGEKACPGRGFRLCLPLIK